MFCLSFVQKKWAHFSVSPSWNMFLNTRQHSLPVGKV
jgi:hypothetical protein